VGILAAGLLINLASVALLWFLGGLFAILRQRDEHGLLAPVGLGSGAATVAPGMVSDLAGTVAALPAQGLRGEHRPRRLAPACAVPQSRAWA
jgi:hypothetical protein